MITDKVGGSSAKPEVSKQSKEKRLKHKVSGYKSQSKRRLIAGCRLLLRTLSNTRKHSFITMARETCQCPEIYKLVPLNIFNYWYNKKHLPLMIILQQPRNFSSLSAAISCISRHICKCNLMLSLIFGTMHISCINYRPGLATATHG